jgi:acyl-CoA reductase-like NAD-dependent aldehyde dehydrogenase
MTTAISSTELVPILFGGKWAQMNTRRAGDVFNPSTGQVIGRVSFSSAEQTGEVVEAAAALYEGFRRLAL